MAIPKVVIVGRPNTGKSSLFNWLAQRRIAIVDDVAGVTRDRVSTLVPLDPGDSPRRRGRSRAEDDPESPTVSRFFELIDTGGIGIVDRDDLSEDVERQIRVAIEEADLILFVVDVREGRMPLDEEVAERLRLIAKPTLLIINKVDNPTLEDETAEFDRLGFEESHQVITSTRTDQRRPALLEAIARTLPALDESRAPGEAVMKLAVVGRPNTGKSTFINTLAQAERMIVSEIPGTTRDSVDVRFEIDDLPFVAIDTAGVRRKAKIRDDLDFYSVHRAERSIRRADVVLLFIDPSQGISRLDKRLADYIVTQYKPCVLVINKWDLIADDPEVEDNREAMREATEAVQAAFVGLPYAPIVFITGQTGRNVKALVNLAQSLYKQANRRVGTGLLNRVVRDAMIAHPPPARGKRPPKVYYATQVAVTPPTLVLFVNRTTGFDPPYIRYLINAFRRQLPFQDIPIRLFLRSRTISDGDRRGRGPDMMPDIVDDPVLAAALAEAEAQGDDAIEPWLDEEDDNRTGSFGTTGERSSRANNLEFLESDELGDDEEEDFEDDIDPDTILHD